MLATDQRVHCIQCSGGPSCLSCVSSEQKLPQSTQTNKPTQKQNVALLIKSSKFDTGFNNMMLFFFFTLFVKVNQLNQKNLKSCLFFFPDQAFLESMHQQPSAFQTTITIFGSILVVLCNLMQQHMTLQDVRYHQISMFHQVIS